MFDDHRGVSYTFTVRHTGRHSNPAVRFSASGGQRRVGTFPAPPTTSGARGESLPLSALVERNYGDLRRIAVRELRSARLARTMSPTSLVSESMVRLMRQRSVPAESAHLLGLATILMVQALSDRAKRRRAIKRGKRIPHFTITGDIPSDCRPAATAEGPADEANRLLHQQLLAHMADLMRSHPRMMEIVTLHLVLDVPMPRVAELLGVSERTCYRECGEGRRKLATRLARDSA